MAFDKQAFAKHLRGHALPGFGVHKCATYVRQAMVAGGLDTNGNPIYAKDYGPFLVRLGFQKVAQGAYVPQVGDIAVMPGNAHSKAGHVAGWDGSNWISDFVQIAMMPGPAYRKRVSIRSTVRPKILCAAVLALAAPAHGASDLVVHEPLLGLRWAAPVVRFDPVDPGLTRRCRDLANANYDHRLWVLARAVTPRGELMVVSGRMIPRRPDLPAEPDDAGVMLRLTTAGCDMIGPADEPFGDADDYAPQVARTELVALAADAARRYVAAYGGARPLCAAAMRQRVRVAALPPLLSRAFRRAAPCLAHRG